MDDRFCPLACVAAATFATAVVWLCALRAALPLP